MHGLHDPIAPSAFSLISIAANRRSVSRWPLIPCSASFSAPRLHSSSSHRRSSKSHCNRWMTSVTAVVIDSIRSFCPARLIVFFAPLTSRAEMLKERFAAGAFFVYYSPLSASLLTQHFFFRFCQYLCAFHFLQQRPTSIPVLCSLNASTLSFTPRTFMCFFRIVLSSFFTTCSLEPIDA